MVFINDLSQWNNYIKKIKILFNLKKKNCEISQWAICVIKNKYPNPHAEK